MTMASTECRPCPGRRCGLGQPVRQAHARRESERPQAAPPTRADPPPQEAAARPPDRPQPRSRSWLRKASSPRARGEGVLSEPAHRQGFPRGQRARRQKRPRCVPTTSSSRRLKRLVSAWTMAGVARRPSARVAAVGGGDTTVWGDDERAVNGEVTAIKWSAPKSVVATSRSTRAGGGTTTSVVRKRPMWETASLKRSASLCRLWRTASTTRQRIITASDGSVVAMGGSLVDTRVQALSHADRSASVAAGVGRSGRWIHARETLRAPCGAPVSASRAEAPDGASAAGAGGVAGLVASGTTSNRVIGCSSCVPMAMHIAHRS